MMMALLLLVLLGVQEAEGEVCVCGGGGGRWEEGGEDGGCSPVGGDAAAGRQAGRQAGVGWIAVCGCCTDGGMWVLQGSGAHCPRFLPGVWLLRTDPPHFVLSSSTSPPAPAFHPPWPPSPPPQV